jgi:hypothetical protein
MSAGTTARSIGEAIVASPVFIAAHLFRYWHLRWGATTEEVAAAKLRCERALASRRSRY